LEGQILELQ